MPQDTQRGAAITTEARPTTALKVLKTAAGGVLMFVPPGAQAPATEAELAASPISRMPVRGHVELVDDIVQLQDMVEQQRQHPAASSSGRWLCMVLYAMAGRAVGRLVELVRGEDTEAARGMARQLDLAYPRGPQNETVELTVKNTGFGDQLVMVMCLLLIVQQWINNMNRFSLEYTVVHTGGPAKFDKNLHQRRRKHEQGRVADLAAVWAWMSGQGPLPAFCARYAKLDNPHDRALYFMTAMMVDDLNRRDLEALLVLTTTTAESCRRLQTKIADFLRFMFDHGCLAGCTYDHSFHHVELCRPSTGSTVKIVVTLGKLQAQ